MLQAGEKPATNFEKEIAAMGDGLKRAFAAAKATRAPDEDQIVEAMALAICNAIRDDHDLPALKNLDRVESPDTFRKQARVALKAYRNFAVGR